MSVVKEEKEKKYYTKTDVKDLGFTEKMIKELLSEPLLVTNPKYKSSSPMKLYLITEVEEVMKSEEFSSWIERNKNRRNGAKKAIQTKREKLHAEILVKIEEIKVERLDIEKLERKTLNEKQDWYNYQGMMRESYDLRNAYSADEFTKQRWMVNYIRHNLTEYDEVLYDMSGKVGCHEEYDIYRKAVLEKIKGVYPELELECVRQIKNIKS